MIRTKIFKLLILLLMCSISSVINAQKYNTEEYTPTTNWPYLNPTFEQGTITLASGITSNAVMNIHLHDGILQCIGAGGRISRVTFTDIAQVTIGSKNYRNIDGTLMECIATNCDSTAFLLLYAEPDFETLLRSSNTYHMNLSTVTSAKIQQLNLKGRNNELHDEMRAVWYDGKRIPLRCKYYINDKGAMTQVTRKNMLSTCTSNEEKKNMKAFIKKNKIKMDNDSDVINLFNWMYTK